MEKIVKLNYDRKVRYIFDKDTLECERLCEIVMEHYGQFLNPPHGWDMAVHRLFMKELRSCGLSVDEFISKEYPQAQKSVTKPKKKPQITVEEEVPKKKPVPPKKAPVTKPTTVKRKTIGAAPSKKKKPTIKKKTIVKKVK